MKIFSINNVSKPRELDERENLKACCAEFKIPHAHTWNTIVLFFLLFIIVFYDSATGGSRGCSLKLGTSLVKMSINKNTFYSLKKQSILIRALFYFHIKIISKPLVSLPWVRLPSYSDFIQSKFRLSLYGWKISGRYRQVYLCWNHHHGGTAFSLTWAKLFKRECQLLKCWLTIQHYAALSWWSQDPAL